MLHFSLSLLNRLNRVCNFHCFILEDRHLPQFLIGVQWHSAICYFFPGIEIMATKLYRISIWNINYITYWAKLLRMKVFKAILNNLENHKIINRFVLGIILNTLFVLVNFGSVPSMCENINRTTLCCITCIFW